MISTRESPDDHLPDSESISDEELKKAIFARWPSENGIAKIHYGFSTKPLVADIIGKYRDLKFFT